MDILERKITFAFYVKVILKSENGFMALPVCQLLVALGVG